MDVNSAWKSTCRLLLGGEIGEIDEFAGYLQQYHYVRMRQEKSAVSGKKVNVGADRYGKAKFISEDEIDYNKKFEPLNINEIKDVDSIVEAFGDRFHYAGNKIFGNTKFAQDVDNCTDSSYVYKSHNIFSSRYIGYSAFVRENSQFVFGSGTLIRGQNLVRVLGGADLARCFECSMTMDSADMYFCHYCAGCSDCMFCFNLRSKRHRIGNVELERSKHKAIKDKLVGEMRESLEKNKSFHSVFGFPSAPKPPPGLKVPKKQAETMDMEPVERAFKEATKLVFEKELGPIEEYGKFLGERVEKIKSAQTPFGNTVYHSDYFWSRNVPKKRMVTHEEADEVGKVLHINPEKVGAGVGGIMRELESMAFFTVEFFEKQNKNCMMTPVRYNGMDSYKVSDSTYSKKCAYCTHLQGCEAVFGSDILMVGCSYCLRCDDCSNCRTSLELDSCKNCYRCMFCHNCEGLSDCMFCFNTKNKRYAIGNVELGREEYEKVRKKVIAELLTRLEKNGSFGFDVCSLGQMSKK